MMTHQGFAIEYLQDEDGNFAIKVPLIPGCVAWGIRLRELKAVSRQGKPLGLQSRNLNIPV
jgi:predicted RNase H-like HicB family nuclease